MSLCIPTNGVVEWFFPVLDSILSQGVDSKLYEIVVVDNGNNPVFKEKIKEYVSKIDNLIYHESSNTGFLNEIDTYKLASGEFVKFVNHRTLLKKGALQYLIKFVQNNRDEKPFVYFANGALLDGRVIQLGSFDGFVRKLSFWSSWSTGMAFWKDDFDSKIGDLEINELFPHMAVLFSETKKDRYLINDKRIFAEIPSDHSKKGKYDLFYAFGVEYLKVLLGLLDSNIISPETFVSVKKDNLFFLGGLYRSFVRQKQPCSYDLSSFDRSVSVFYSPALVKKASFSLLLRFKNKIKSFLVKKRMDTLL